MLKHYLVVYDSTHVVSIEEYDNAKDATPKLHAIIDAQDGRSANVVSASSREALGIQVGDPKSVDDEFDFRGFEE